MLDEYKNNDVSIDSLGAVLDAVHLKTMTSFTLYSNFIDLKEKKIYLYYMSQYQELIEINMAEELSNGQRVVNMRDMFSEETVLAGDKEYRWFEIKSTLFKIAVIVIGLAIIAGIILIIFNVIKKKRSK
jgi:hypothetical protein